MNANRLAGWGLALGLMGAAAGVMAQEPAASADELARGRYMTVIGGCNDCHTAGYAENAGNTPDAEWLTGVPIGFAGPWGVSYPANLRLNVQSMSEDQWVARVRSPLLPPMPWFSVAHMKEEDVRAMYRFIKSLGPAGEAMPAFVAPGGKVETPVMDFYPHPFGSHSDAPIAPKRAAAD